MEVSSAFISVLYPVDSRFLKQCLSLNFSPFSDVVASFFFLLMEYLTHGVSLQVSLSFIKGFLPFPDPLLNPCKFFSMQSFQAGLHIIHLVPESLQSLTFDFYVPSILDYFKEIRVITHVVEETERPTLRLLMLLEVQDEGGMIGRLRICIMNNRMSECVQPLKIPYRMVNLGKSAVFPFSSVGPRKLVPPFGDRMKIFVVKPLKHVMGFIRGDL